jgi:uroporphyrin-3 C-methyltransferase
MAEAKRINKKVIIFIVHAVTLIIIAGCLAFIGWQNYRLKNDVQDLQATVDQVREQKPVNWVLPEINYLVQIADINLRINKDISGALNVLQTADKKLAKFDNLDFAQIRQALTNDISTLQASGRVNIADTIAQIALLARRIENLPIIPSAPYKKPSQAEPDIGTKMPQSLWQKFVTETGTKLKDIIVIRRLEQPIEPLPTLEEQIYLKQNITFMLEQAEWAALHRETQIYNGALKRAAKMANICFAHNLAALNNITQTLQTLQKINIDPPMPNISQSLQAISELMAKEQA